MKIKATGSTGSRIVDTSTEPTICRVAGYRETEAVNLATGERLWYSLPPEKAVVCAHEYSRGNKNTWAYDFTKAQRSTSGKTWICGDWAALAEK